MSYKDQHRLFLQFTMGDPVVSELEALRKYGMILCKFVEDGPAPTLDNLGNFIDEINEEISALEMQLRIQTCEVTTQRYLTLINTVPSPISATMTKYSIHELLYYKAVVDEIVGSEEGKVSHINCLNIEGIQSLRKADFEKLLIRFVEEWWLTAHDDGKYSLGVRCLSELRPFLTSTYKDYLMTCVLCSEMIFQGFRCDECGEIGHVHCLHAYAMRNREKTRIKCPGKNCNEPLVNLAQFLAADSVEDGSEQAPASKKSRKETN